MELHNLTHNLYLENQSINIDGSAYLGNCKLYISNNVSNNTIIIEENCKLHNLTIRIEGSNTTVHIKKGVGIGNGLLWLEYNGKILIGSGTRIEDANIASLEGKHINIGDECLFAHDIEIRTGDSHFIYEKDTTNRINHASDIIIENNVWVCAHCKIMKGVTVKDNCVIGSSSLVNNSFEESNVIIAGVPAKIIKRNIEWSRWPKENK